MLDRGRPRRSPARFLAPLALAATCAGIYLIVSHSLRTPSPTAGSSATAPRQDTSATNTSKSTQTQTTSTGGAGASAEFYVVRTGDTLSEIALRTHVAVATIERLNPGVSAHSLQVGQRLRLRR